MKANTDIEQYLSKLSGLARVLHNHVLTVHGKSEHTVRITNDSKKCDITAICVLPDGQVLVADRDNKRVKLLNQQYQVVSHWDVNDGKWDICQITPSEVAVPMNNEVQFITVSQSQLAIGRKLELQHSCISVAHHRGDLFIASGTALFKYKLNGKLVCRLYEDKSDNDTGKNRGGFIIITFVLCTGVF
ncbi:hypothetical protein DPMN_061700 [Dreissena polymorpha]|uniref:Uncharacterized protein n=1 Tax=Dreissena polymorpha TaxID=45954 RepID=A0A9D4C8A4_DREPO|nr:hypothetical protein DPMN_061700 [Dreissena polymorpha]